MAMFRRAKGSTVPPVLPPSIVYSDSTTIRRVGPGGGYGWGPGPRAFVGSRGPAPAPIVEVGREGDFVEGDPEWGPAEDDQGFPHATRWPGYPATWEQPFYEATQYIPPGGPGIYGGAPGAYGFGNRFMGGALLESRVSTVFACADLISRTLSTMNILASAGSTPEPAPAWCNNPEPEIYASIVDAMKALTNSLLLRGEALIAPTARYADDTVARWVVLNPDAVQIDDNGGGLPVYTLPRIGQIPRSEILHIRYQVWPGEVHGVGPLEAAARNLCSADALQAYGTNLAVSNGIPMAVLQSATKLTKPQANDLKRSWAEATLSRGVLPAILSGGLTYTPLNLKPSDIGLLDLRLFDEQRIASCFGVPLWLVGLPWDSQSLTYSTVAGQFDYFWRATLRAMSYNIMQALSGWALARGHWVRHDSESLVRPDLSGRAQAYSLLIPQGVLTVNEARAWENLAPINSPADATPSSEITVIQQQATGGVAA